MEANVVKFFKKLINEHEREDRETRVVNLTGHLGKRASAEMRKWFLQLYPSPSDHIVSH